jgi:phage terminase large subunit-like protein
MTCARKGLDIRDYKGRKCYIGLDLAQKIDLAALTILFPEEDGSVTAFHRHYLPEHALLASTPARHEAYVQWEEDGLLTVTVGAATDYNFIKDEILYCAKQYDLQMVGYDPYSASQFAISLEKSDIEMVEVKQGISHLSEPAKMVQALVAQGKLNYDEEDKAFEWCCANAVCFKDINENMKVLKDKSKPHDKIDSIISTIIGMQLCELKTPIAKMPYRKRGLITT